MGIDDASESAITSLETSSDGLNDQRALDSFCGSWDYDEAKDSWLGPFWKDTSGDGSFADQKQNSIEDVFGGTTRTWMTMYSITEQGREDYYDPVINGEDDQEYTNFAQDLVDMDMADTILRPNPEHNLSNLPRYPANEDGSNISTVSTAGQKYADAFAHVVDVMMGVSGANFDWLYSPIGDYAGADIGSGAGADDDIVQEAWPPDSSLWPSGVENPIVCPSFYDTVNDGGLSCSQWQDATDTEKENDAKDVWTNQLKPELDSYTEWANNDINARLGLVEWGHRIGTSSTCAGDARGDNPWFMDLTINYCRNEGYEFQHPWGYFHANDTNSILWRSGEPYDSPRSTDAWAYQAVNGEGKYIASNP